MLQEKEELIFLQVKTLLKYSSNTLEIHMKHTWNSLKTLVKCSWKPLEMHSKHSWNSLGKTFETLLKRSWNILETFWKHPWNTLETILKHPWNNLKTLLKHSLNTLEMHFNWTQTKRVTEWLWHLLSCSLRLKIS